MKQLIAVFAALVLAACGDGKKQEVPGTGGMRLGIHVAAVQEAPAVVSATLKITYPGGTVEEHTSKVLPWDFEDTPCPVGSYSYTVTAQVGAASFSAAGSFSIAAGSVTRLDVMMQQTNATPMAVVAPYVESIAIEGLNAEGSGGWRVPLKLKAKVTHPDNDQPDMDWFVSTWSHECDGVESGGHGFFFLPLDVDFYIDGFSKPTAEVKTTFTSFCQGDELITFEAVNTNNLLCPDKGCELVSRVSFTIPYDPQGMAMDIAFNYAPKVSCDRVDNAEPLPLEEVRVTATASDPEGESMTYAWSATCGTFKEGTANKLEAIWIAPDSACQACTLKLDVTDASAGTNHGTITVKTAPADVTKGCPASVPEAS